uniref:Uncharacterized protein n=1 Tax=Tanacetum cinerariifolium TaxID=118510 RepID=A0A699GUM3_TANCI|nr:hypothetical protein [Tanacetum cinerariifolium]GEW37503.1 hypothetical protein [Tanacetum cinerariifolium]
MFETASKNSRNPPLSEVNTSRSGDDIIEHLDGLTDFVPPTPHDSPLLGDRVLSLEEAQTTQDKVITRLKLRVRRLEKKRKARTSQPMKRRLFKGRVETRIEKSLEVIVEDKRSGEKSGSTVDQVSTARLEVSVANVPVNVSAATPSTPPTTTTIFGDEDLTIAQTLIKLRSEKQRKKELLLEIIDYDHELAVKMTNGEQEKYTIKERARLLAEYFERKKKQLAAERAEAIKNKPSTRTQELQKLYQKEQKWINDFVSMDLEKEEKKSIEPKSKGKKEKRIKRVADLALKQEFFKKQKMIQESPKSDEEESVGYEHEKEELRMWLTVVSDKEETVDLEILSTKQYPEGYNMLLWGDLKVMFEPNAEDEIWSNQQDWNLISWKLYENGGVHTLLMDGTLNCFNMLVEKRYPLIKEMLEKTLNWKLEAKAESTMAFELLKFIKSLVEK